jgi:hypothetical protein
MTGTLYTMRRVADFPADYAAKCAAAQSATFKTPSTRPSRCWYYLHALGGPRRCLREPDYHDGPHEYPPAPAEEAA